MVDYEDKRRSVIFLDEKSLTSMNYDECHYYRYDLEMEQEFYGSRKFGVVP